MEKAQVHLVQGGDEHPVQPALGSSGQCVGARESEGQTQEGKFHRVMGTRMSAPRVTVLKCVKVFVPSE